MAYFLKKTKTKYDVYLQIYESYYDPEKKCGAHRSYKPVGYVKKLQAEGIEDPISHFQEEVASLNRTHKEKKQSDKVRQISDESPERHLGYFPLKNINDALRVKQYIDLMQTATDLRFNVFDFMSALVYSRAVMPCSKRKTFEDVLPKLYESSRFSLDQIYSGLEYIGLEYEKIIEIYNHQIDRKYPINTSHTYFDCTNFYFEIDKEDDFRRKGPSKENRHDPLVGLGLLLDANQIPIGMKLYPGNESEKPLLRKIIDDLKERNRIKGRTIQVADKGLNCSENILHARKGGDGYIFSKSIKQLPETEKVWVLLEDDYKKVKDASGKELYRYKSCIDEFPYDYTDEKGKRIKIKLTEKRVVTFNPQLAKKKIYEIDRQVEKARQLTVSKAKKSEYGDSAKYVTFEAADKKGKSIDGKIAVSINTRAIEADKKLAGYNLIVTSETKLSSKEIYSAYHNLWRIEESFKVMKSQLDARPVYLQKKETINGHFLICYLAVLLTRLLQFKVLENQYCTEEIISFIKTFRTAKISERKSINLAKAGNFISALRDKTNLPLTTYFLTDSDIKKMLSHRF